MKKAGPPSAGWASWASCWSTCNTNLTYSNRRGSWQPNFKRFGFMFEYLGTLSPEYMPQYHKQYRSTYSRSKLNVGKVLGHGTNVSATAVHASMLHAFVFHYLLERSECSNLSEGHELVPGLRASQFLRLRRLVSTQVEMSARERVPITQHNDVSQRSFCPPQEKQSAFASNNWSLHTAVCHRRATR